MKTRIATEIETKAAVTEIVNQLKLDSEELFDYTDDDIIDDYLSIINNVSVVVIETEYTYNIVNVVMITIMDMGSAINNQTFLTFDGTKLYPYNVDGFMNNETTEEEYIEILKEQNELKTLEGDVNRYHSLMTSCDPDDAINYLNYVRMYSKAVKNLNDFYNENLKSASDK